jgi:hypothetical protein
LDGGSENVPKSTKYEQILFCETIKIDMANSNDKSFNNTVSSTLSLITVLFKVLFETINIHKEFCGEKLDPQPSISLLNKTDTFDGYVGGFVFERGIFNNDEYSAVQKESLMLFEGYCIFGYWEFYKNLHCIFDGSKQNHVWKL